MGRTAAPVPLIETLVMGALPIARFGSPEQREALLPAVAEGRSILSAALVEAQADPLHPITRAPAIGHELEAQRSQALRARGRARRLRIHPRST